MTGADTAKYGELFISEAHDHLDALDAGLLRFEKQPHSVEIAQELMRHSHTLKGMVASIEYGDLSNLAHSFEGMVENVKNGLSPSGAIELLFGALDELRKLVEATGQSESKHAANPLVDRVGELEEEDHATEIQAVERPETFRQISEVKVRADKLDKLVDLAAELLVSKLHLAQNYKGGVAVGKSRQEDIGSEASEALEGHGRLIDELQYQVLQLRLTPLSQVFNRFPRMIRDLAKQEKKEVELVIKGGEVELDRSVLDVLGEPLIHLLRNAVDHGIDKKGVVSLTAERVKNHAVIKVNDDGQGIDWEKLKQKQKGLNKELPLESFLFSGVSTSEEVTEISGRGVGLSVVKTKIEELGGQIEVESETGKGTIFLLHLPISLAIIKALLVKIAGRLYAVPITSVNRLLSLSSLEVKRQADQEVTIVDEEEVLLVDMNEVLGLQTGRDKNVLRLNLSPGSRALKGLRSEKGEEGKEEERFDDKKGEKIEQSEIRNQKSEINKTVMLTQGKNKRVGLIVDSVETQQDIIVKSLNKKLREQGYFSAVTILGDGEPVPIIDVESIVSSL